MSRRTALSAKAIREAWELERWLVEQGYGTRDWTPKQQEDILKYGKAYDDDGYAFQGQHMKSAEKYPEYQGDRENIQFLTREEHLEAHDGNWQNPTNWYFDPVTKEKTNFGDGKYIPCEHVQLSNSIVLSRLVVKRRDYNYTRAKIKEYKEKLLRNGKKIPDKKTSRHKLR